MDVLYVLKWWLMLGYGKVTVGFSFVKVSYNTTWMA